MTYSKKSLEDLEYQITGAAIEVHRNIGPGLLESVYQQCLAYELHSRNISFTQELSIPVLYKEQCLQTSLRIDFFVEESIILELKAMEKILPIHEAQILTYMKLTNVPKGILFNFNVLNIVTSGKKSMVNELYRDYL